MLERGNTMLIFIDVQGSLAYSMYGREDLFKNLKSLVAGIRLLEIPILWTEQNPLRLGDTIPEVAHLMSPYQPISKMSFSCCRNDGFLKALKASSEKQLLLAGIEAHICIYQTTLDLLAMGYEVHIVSDCVSSRALENKIIALEKMKDAGAMLTTAEMLLFELLRTAEAPQFRELVKIVK